MGDENDRALATGELAEQAHCLALEPGIEARSGLVEQQDRGLVNEFGGDTDPLSLAAGIPDEGLPCSRAQVLSDRSGRVGDAA